jgi:hypothetical protein
MIILSDIAFLLSRLNSQFYTAMLALPDSSARNTEIIGNDRHRYSEGDRDLELLLP